MVEKGLTERRLELTVLAILIQHVLHHFNIKIPHGYSITIALALVEISHRIVKAIPWPDGKFKTFLQNLKVL